MISSYLQNKKLKQGGYTLFEIIIYTGILAVVFVAVFSMIMNILQATILTKINDELRISGSTTIERMEREIRSAYAIDSENCIFDTHPGELQLYTKDEFGAAKTVRFFFDSSEETIRIEDDGVDKGSFIADGVAVTNFIIRKSENAQSSLVKVELTLESKKKDTMTANFWNSAVLRGSYTN